MVYPHNGILFINKKKWSSDTCYNMDEPWKYYAKFKKKSQSQKVAYCGIPFTWNVQHKQIQRDRKSVGSCVGLEDGGWEKRMDSNCWKLRVPSRKRWWKCYKIDCSDGCTTPWI